jgi:hypothetical protein
MISNARIGFFMISACALVANCQREQPVYRRRYVLPPEVDVVTDVMVPDRLCALRAIPSEDLSTEAGVARPTIAWSGSHYGVAWQKQEGANTGIVFARLLSNGGLANRPVMVTDRAFKAGAPTVAWSGANWVLLFDGGFGEQLGDVYQARVDVRGVPVGLPWRMIRGPRDDGEPAYGAGAMGFGLAWISIEERGRRHVLYGQVLNRWNAPVGLAVRLLDTNLTLGGARVTFTGSEWAFTCVSARQEVGSVDFFRLDDKGRPKGILQHISAERIGGVDTERRYDIAWDGSTFGVVWSELRGGAMRVIFRRVSARGNPLGPDVWISEGAPSASEPAIVRVADSVFVVAMRVEREGIGRTWLRTVDGNGTVQQSRVELQGADGTATAPVMVRDETGVGVVTQSRQGIAFHRVLIGPCVAPLRVTHCPDFDCNTRQTCSATQAVEGLLVGDIVYTHAGMG